MSDPAEQRPDPTETPAQHVAELTRKKNLYQRVTASVPLLVTVIVHLVLIAGAAAVVVQQSGGFKKKTFEASNQNEAPAVKAVEHRLQVARRGGASGGPSNPVSASRITTTADNAMVLPEMTELPKMGASGFGGFSAMGTGIGVGDTGGMATALGGSGGLGGKGFVSMSFLGTTNQARNVVFVVDVSKEIMDLKKGGFRAFTIIREEIMSLVGRLPPSSKFNVILYQQVNPDLNSAEVNLFSKELATATSDTKKEFFAWMAPVNASLEKLGPKSAGARIDWKETALPANANIDPLFLPPVWSRAARIAMEQQPDVIYVITNTAGAARRKVSEDTVRKRRDEVEKRKEEYRRQGIDIDSVGKARNAAYAKARQDFDAANKKLVEMKKDPIIITHNEQIFRPDIQAALKRAGYPITLDTTGWTDKSGKTITDSFYVSTVEGAEWADFVTYFSRLQRALLPDRAVLNTFLFVGPDDKPDTQVANLTMISKRNGGSFQLLTTKRLEELRAQARAETK